MRKRRKRIESVTVNPTHQSAKVWDPPRTAASGAKIAVTTPIGKCAELSTRLRYELGFDLNAR